MSLLRVKALSLEIGERLLCRRLDFSLQPGQRWGILGANGAGKTTLLHTLAGLRVYKKGQIFVGETELGEWRRKALARRLGVLFQSQSASFPVSVMEAALAGRHPHIPFLGMEGREDMALARQVLRDVALEAMATRQVDTLSGGERQRLAIATILLQNPLLYLLDEPTNHLDVQHQMRLLHLLTERVASRQGGLLMVLQDSNLVRRFCSHAMLIIAADSIILGPAAEVINKDNLELLYQHPIRQLEGEDGSRYFLPG